MEIVQNQQAAPSTAQVKLYNPDRYAIIGFFLSLVPVFIMSLSNARHLQNGKIIRSTILKFMAGYVVLLITYYSLFFWSSSSVIDAMLSMRAAGEFSTFFMKNGSLILAVLGTLLLILLIRALNKQELSEYQELQKAGLVNKRSAFLPIMIGLAYTLAIFVFAPNVMRSIMTKQVEQKVMNRIINPYPITGTTSPNPNTTANNPASNSNIAPNIPSTNDRSPSEVGAAPAPTENDICGLITAAQIYQITKIDKLHAEPNKYGPLCAYKDERGSTFFNSARISLRTDLSQEKAARIESFKQMNIGIDIVPFDQIQNGAFMIRNIVNNTEDFYFMRNSQIYSITADRMNHSNILKNASAMLGAAILGVPYSEPAAQ